MYVATCVDSYSYILGLLGNYVKSVAIAAIAIPSNKDLYTGGAPLE